MFFKKGKEEMLKNPTTSPFPIQDIFPMYLCIARLHDEQTYTMDYRIFYASVRIHTRLCLLTT